MIKITRFFGSEVSFSILSYPNLILTWLEGLSAKFVSFVCVDWANPPWFIWIYSRRIILKMATDNSLRLSSQITDRERGKAFIMYRNWHGRVEGRKSNLYRHLFHLGRRENTITFCDTLYGVTQKGTFVNQSRFFFNTKDILLYVKATWKKPEMWPCGKFPAWRKLRVTSNVQQEMKS